MKKNWFEHHKIPADIIVFSLLMNVLTCCNPDFSIYSLVVLINFPHSIYVIYKTKYILVNICMLMQEHIHDEINVR